MKLHDYGTPGTTADLSSTTPQQAMLVDLTLPEPMALTIALGHGRGETFGAEDYFAATAEIRWGTFGAGHVAEIDMGMGRAHSIIAKSLQVIAKRVSTSTKAGRVSALVGLGGWGLDRPTFTQTQALTLHTSTSVTAPDFAREVLIRRGDPTGSDLLVQFDIPTDGGPGFEWLRAGEPSRVMPLPNKCRRLKLTPTTSQTVELIWGLSLST